MLCMQRVTGPGLRRAGLAAAFNIVLRQALVNDNCPAWVTSHLPLTLHSLLSLHSSPGA